MAEETQDYEVPDLSLNETPEVDNSVAEADSKVHPAYEKLLSELPEAWHAKVTPHLQEQDKYFQQQLEKYTPYKDLVEQGIDPALVTSGLGLAKAIEADPVRVFTALKEHLMSQGMLEADAAEVAQDVMDDAEDDEDSEVPASVKREIEALRQQQEQLAEYANNQIFQQETDFYTQQIESEMGALRQKYDISDAHETAIYDLMNAAIDAGRDISVFDAAKQLAQMVGGFKPLEAPDLSAPAPTIVGSAGGAGVPVQGFNIPKDDKGKREMLAKMFEDYKRANQ
jgi:hypothetical protein